MSSVPPRHFTAAAMRRSNNDALTPVRNKDGLQVPESTITHHLKKCGSANRVAATNDANRFYNENGHFADDLKAKLKILKDNKQYYKEKISYYETTLKKARE